MKICWDSLEGVRLTKNGTFKKGNSTYYYVDKCDNCGSSFLSVKRGGVLTKYCCTSCAGVGREFTDEHKKNLSIALSGENNFWFGKKHTVEYKQRMSEMFMGRKVTVETRQKMSKSGIGKVVSKETRQKLSDINIGKIDGNKNYFWRGGVKKLNIPLYDTYGPQLSIFEEVHIYMLLVNGVVYKTLQIRCNESGCRKWFLPTLIQVKNRLQSFNGAQGQSNFYCSEECKATCSTYGQVLYPKDQNPNKKNLPYTRPEYDFYRQTVLEREDYLCEYCGVPATCVHHEQTQKEQPMLALDPDYGHACCDPCHYEYGHKTGTECSTGNLANKVC